MFKNLIKANEAAIKVVQGEYAKAEAQALKVENTINEGIRTGKRGVSIEGEVLEQSVQAKLRQLGYSVSYNNDQRDGGYTNITW